MTPETWRAGALCTIISWNLKNRLQQHGNMTILWWKINKTSWLIRFQGSASMVWVPPGSGNIGVFWLLFIFSKKAQIFVAPLARKYCPCHTFCVRRFKFRDRGHENKWLAGLTLGQVTPETSLTGFIFSVFVYVLFFCFLAFHRFPRGPIWAGGEFLYFGSPFYH